MERIPYFDAHCDTLLGCIRGGSLRSGPAAVALDRTGAFSPFAQVFALFYNTDFVPPEQRPAETARYHDCYLRELQRCGDLAVHCTGRDSVLRAAEAGKAAALLSIEDAALIGCDPAALETAAAWGVQFINITWNHRNLLSGSCADTPEQGLTDRGRAFVREAERLGIRMDVSHLSERGFWDLAEMAERPIVASHSNSAALWPHRRNLTDDQFRAVAASGGVVGLNVYQDFLGEPGAGIPVFIAHLEHFLELGGEDAVGLGTDFDGCAPVCAGLEDIGAMPRLWEALCARGYSGELLRKLFFENWLRVLRP